MDAPKKLYLIQDNGLVCYCRSNKDDIEYIHKDAFIDKACEWLRKGGSGWYLYSESGEENIDFVKLAEDFRKAMEDKQ